MAPNLPSFILYLSRSLLIFPFQAVFPIYLVCLAIFNILRYSKGDFYIRNIVYYLSIPTQPELLDQRERDARSHNRCIRIEISYIERIESHHIYIYSIPFHASIAAPIQNNLAYYATTFASIPTYVFAYATGGVGYTSASGAG